MKSNNDKIKLMQSKLDKTILDQEFMVRVYEETTKFLASKINQAITKREANKIHALLLPEYPNSRMFWNKTSYGTIDFKFERDSHESYNDRISVTPSVCSLSESVYSQYIHDKNLESLTWSKEHLENYRKLKISLIDLIDLLDKQQTERDELQAKQELELQTFQAQADCPDCSIDWLFSYADKVIQE